MWCSRQHLNTSIHFVRGQKGVAGLGCGLGTLAIGLQITSFPPLASGLEQVTNFSDSLEKNGDNNSIKQCLCYSDKLI